MADSIARKDRRRAGYDDYGKPGSGPAVLAAISDMRAG